MNWFDDGNRALIVTDQTVVEPLVFAATLALGVILVVLPRRYAVVPFILLASFLPVSQRVAIAELDFNMIRVLLLFGWLRYFLRGEFYGFKLGRLDYLFLGWVGIGSVVYILGRGTVDDAIYKLGVAYDFVGMFVLFRCWLRDFPSLRVAVVASACTAVCLAAFMSIEFATGRNFFSVFGGVPEFTVIRDGRLRCSAAFTHPIMAGSVGAALAPLCLWLLVQDGRHRVVGALGWLATSAIVGFSASSGPLIGWLAGMGAWGLWFARDYLRWVRWTALFLVVALHVIANRPVWAWIGLMNIVGASTSYHRVALINAAVDNFSEWALLGVVSTAHWGYGLSDVTNQYILEGIRGGIWGFTALIVLLVVAFACVGAAARGLRKLRSVPVPGGRRNATLLCWAVGSALFVHTVNFMGVSYFGQITVFLIMGFAMSGGVLSAVEQLERHPHRPRTPRSQRVRALLRPTAPTASSVTPV